MCCLLLQKCKLFLCFSTEHLGWCYKIVVFLLSSVQLNLKLLLSTSSQDLFHLMQQTCAQSFHKLKTSKKSQICQVLQELNLQGQELSSSPFTTIRVQKSYLFGVPRSCVWKYWTSSICVSCMYDFAACYCFSAGEGVVWAFLFCFVQVQVSGKARVQNSIEVYFVVVQ